eukprot:10623469-Alexandrium_andersonii.AAC.1
MAYRLVVLGSEQLQPQRTPCSVSGPGRELVLGKFQAGVPASRSQLRRKGPTRADCIQERPLRSKFRDPES